MLEFLMTPQGVIISVALIAGIVAMHYINAKNL